MMLVDCRNCLKFIRGTQQCQEDIDDGDNRPLSPELINNDMTCGPYVEAPSKWKRIPCVYM